MLKDKDGEFESYIAYHYFIDVDGKIYNTRHIDDKSQHTRCGLGLEECKNNYEDINDESIAIVVAGNFVSDKPTTRQLASLGNLLNMIITEYDLPVSSIIGHIDASPTRCPGLLLEYYNQFSSSNHGYVHITHAEHLRESIADTIITKSSKGEGEQTHALQVQKLRRYIGSSKTSPRHIQLGSSPDGQNRDDRRQDIRPRYRNPNKS